MTKIEIIVLVFVILACLTPGAVYLSKEHRYNTVCLQREDVSTTLDLITCRRQLRFEDQKRNAMEGWW